MKLKWALCTDKEVKDDIKVDKAKKGLGIEKNYPITIVKFWGTSWFPNENKTPSLLCKEKKPVCYSKGGEKVEGLIELSKN